VDTKENRSRTFTAILGVGVLALAASACGGSPEQTEQAQGQPMQAMDAQGAPLFQVDPFWPKPLPNRWSMQQVTGIHVDHMDHVWFINRNQAATPNEISGDINGNGLCCVLGPEIIELDQEGNVVNAWGDSDHHPLWPASLQTVIADTQGFVWVAGTGPQDSILKFTREGEFVWDFGHRQPPGTPNVENNQETDTFRNKGRFQLDEVDNELYIIDQKRVVVFDASTGAFKRGWGGHGMPLSEVTNDPIPGYTWDGGPPPDVRDFVPDLHFVEISNDRKVYVGERGANRIQVFTTAGEWLQDIHIAPNTPARGCGGLTLGDSTWSPCGTMYKMVISKDPEQKYLFAADGNNHVVWIVDRASGETLGHFSEHGRLAGQLHFPNAIGIDTFGNIYTGEVDNGKRIQKFAPVMEGAP
jgi:hypothetical protein